MRECTKGGSGVANVRLFRIGGLTQDLADVSSVWEPKFWRGDWTVFVETHRGMKCYERFSTEDEATAFYEELLKLWAAIVETPPGQGGPTSPSSQDS